MSTKRAKKLLTADDPPPSIEQVFSALRSTRTRAAAARKLGCSLAALRRWLTTEPMRSALQAEFMASFAPGLLRLSDRFDDSVRALERLMDAGEPTDAVQLGAASRMVQATTKFFQLISAMRPAGDGEGWEIPQHEPRRDDAPGHPDPRTLQ